MTNRPLVVVGAVLAIVGVVMLIVVLTQGVTPQPVARNLPQLEEPYESDSPSRGWAIAAGLTVAVGAACIMIGMNRWGARRARN